MKIDEATLSKLAEILLGEDGVEGVMMAVSNGDGIGIIVKGAFSDRDMMNIKGFLDKGIERPDDDSVMH